MDATPTTGDAVADAISRGAEASRTLIHHRDQLFTSMEAILGVPGVDLPGLQACVAGVLLAVQLEHLKGRP